MSRLDVLRQRRRRRGFTLIELLVAMMAGVIVAMGAFAFAKASTRTFQSELRLAAANNAVTMGFRRLASDIQRAAFLSTPNIQRDFYAGNGVCVDPTGMTPVGIQTLAGVFIEYAASAPNAAFQAAHAAQPVPLALPDRITLAGAFDSSEQFTIRSIATGGGSLQLNIASMSGASSRVTQNNIAPNPPLDQTVIRPNRIARVVDTRGYQHFGVVQSVTVVPDPANPAVPRIQVVLQPSPPMYVQGTGFGGGITNPACYGMDPGGTGMLFNVVNKVRYEVRDLSTGTDSGYYAALYANPNAQGQNLTGVPEDAARADLVRVELDSNDQPIAGTSEIVAEYALDLRFGITVDTNTASIVPGTAPTPIITTYGLGDPNVYKWGRSATLARTSSGPERIKSIRVRFSTRSREADRASDVAAPFDQPDVKQAWNGLPGGMYRYDLSTTYKGARQAWARVKTLQAEVALLNQLGVNY